MPFDSNVRYGISQVGAKNVIAAFKGIDTNMKITSHTMKNKLLPATRISNMGLMNMGRIAQDAPFGLMGISNNLTFMAEQMGRAKEQGHSFTSQLKGMGRQMLGVGGLTFAFSILTSALLAYQMGVFDFLGGAGKKFTEMIDKQIEKVVKLKDILGKPDVLAVDEAERELAITETLRKELELIQSLNERKERQATYYGVSGGLTLTAEQLEIARKLTDKEVRRIAIYKSYEEKLKGIIEQGEAQLEIQDALSFKAEGTVAIATKWKTELEGVKTVLEEISQSGAFTSRRATQDGRASIGVPKGLMENVFQPKKPKLLKDADKVGRTIFDNWSNILVSNMNTAWVTIFGEANSLFEQLINSMVNMLIGQVFSGLLSFLPGGSIVGGIVGLFSGGGASGATAPVTNLTIEMGGMPLGQVVLEGNRQISQRRLV